MNQPIQPARPPSARKELRDWIDSDEFKTQIQRAMPQGMIADRFVRILATATMRNPKLLECTKESFFKCVLDLSAMGLEPDGRRAHLIPFKDNRNQTVACTLIVDYKGIAELVRKNGDVKSIHCDIVGKNDQFVCRYGTGGKLEHVPYIVDRGDVYAVYSYVTLNNGAEEWEVMSIEEVERIRKRSRSANDGPWVSDYNEMAKKTIFRRHSKTLVLSPETRQAVEYGEEEEFERFRNAVPARTPKSAFLDGLSAVEPPEPPDDTSSQKEETKGPKTPPLTPSTAADIPKHPTEVKTHPTEPRPAPKKEPKPKPATKADQLASALEAAGIDWPVFAGWVAEQTSEEGKKPQPVAIEPKDLPASVLADCVLNFDANREMFEEWLAREREKEQVP